jgi:hypothetical protein
MPISCGVCRFQPSSVNRGGTWQVAHFPGRRVELQQRQRDGGIVQVDLAGLDRVWQRLDVDLQPDGQRRLGRDARSLAAGAAGAVSTRAVGSRSTSARSAAAGRAAGYRWAGDAGPLLRADVEIGWLLDASRREDIEAIALIGS